MSLEVNGHNIFLILLVCFTASIIFVYLIGKIATYLGLMDIPFEKRKIHKKPIPTLGGVGIFLSFLFGYMLFGPNNNLMISILMASFLVLLLGIFDDFTKSRTDLHIPARYKFFIHIIIASIVVFYGGLELSEVTFLTFNLNFGALSPYISIFIIVAIINAINLIDGLDGLSSGISSIYFLTIAILGFILNKFGGLDVTLSIIMLGATLGYLAHNFPPASVYMGDTGATFIGLMIAVISLLGFKTLTFTSLVIPLLILAIPMFDTLFAIIRRRIQRKSIGEADKEHIHHQILKLTSSKTKTVLIIYGVNILFSLTSILFALGHKKEMIICYIILMFLLVWVILKTDIIFKRKRSHK